MNQHRFFIDVYFYCLYAHIVIYCSGIYYLFLDHLGCFHDDAEHPVFNHMPGDLDPAHVTPPTCLDACSTDYQYAAISSTDSVCLCASDVNSTMKIDDGHCLENLMHYDVYWREQGIVGLLLNANDRVELFAKTWFNASVLNQNEVEFR